MTRGQEALLIVAGDAPSNAKTVAMPLDLSQFALPVLSANAQEVTAHEEVLLQLDKSSGGKTVWRQLQLA
jgi:DNA polymerase-3 subunit epsilon